MAVPYRFVVLAVGTGAQASFSAVLVGVAAIAPALQERYGLSLSEAGVVLAAPGIGQLLTLLLWGIAVDRFGERLISAAGLAAAAGALVGASFSPDTTTLVVLLALSGVFGGSVNSATGRAVIAWFPPTQRGTALGVRQTAIPIGGVAAAVALPAIAAGPGLEWAFIALAAACLACSVAAALALREGPPAIEETRALEALAHPLRDRRIWLLSVGSALLVCTQASVLGFAALFLHGDRGFSPQEAGVVLAAMNVVGAALRIASGRWSDRLGDRLFPLRAIALAVTISVAAAAALATAPAVVLVPAFVVAGGLSMGWNGLSFAAAAELAGRRRSGAAIGFQQTALTVGGTLAPLAFAALVTATSWRTGFAVAALCPLAALYLLRGVDT